MVRPRRGCRERRSRDDGRARAAAGVSVRVDVRACDYDCDRDRDRRVRASESAAESAAENAAVGRACDATDVVVPPPRRLRNDLSGVLWREAFPDEELL